MLRENQITNPSESKSPAKARSTWHSAKGQHDDNTAKKACVMWPKVEGIDNDDRDQYGQNERSELILERSAFAGDKLLIEDIIYLCEMKY